MLFPGQTDLGQHLSLWIMASPLALAVTGWIYYLGSLMLEDVRASIPVDEEPEAIRQRTTTNDERFPRR